MVGKIWKKQTKTQT